MAALADPARVVARRFPATARHPHLPDRGPALTAAATAASGLAVFAVIAMAGGEPSAIVNFAYVPIALAAYRSGARGGILAALLGALMLGPVMLAAVPRSDFGLPWLVRGAFFVGAGAIVGWLFDRSRSATRAWRAAAVQVVSEHHGAMIALAEAAEAKDPTTGDHMYRCRDLADALAREAGMQEADVADVAWSAMLHDIGKLWVPDHVLTKPGALGPAEWEAVRQHPARGADLLERAGSFETASRIARWHHENLDGSGYPDGLRGAAIPLEARIVRVVDAWDAMVSDRPYRRAMAPERAMQELRDGAGRQFDPELVALFLAMAEAGRLRSPADAPLALPSARHAAPVAPAPASRRPAMGLGAPRVRLPADADPARGWHPLARRRVRAGAHGDAG